MPGNPAPGWGDLPTEGASLQVGPGLIPRKEELIRTFYFGRNIVCLIFSKGKVVHGA